MLDFLISTSASITLTTSFAFCAQITAGTRGAKIYEVKLSFDGATSTNPRVELLFYNGLTAGTGGTALTPYKLDQNDGRSLLVTAKQGTFGVDPSAGTQVWAEYDPPYSPFVYRFARPLIMAPSTVFGFSAKAASSPPKIYWTITGNDNPE